MLEEKPARYTIEEDEWIKFYFYITQQDKHSHHCKLHDNATVIIDYDKENNVIGVEVLVPKQT